MVGTLFVYVKAAFPTVNPQRLTNTLIEMGFCPSLTRLIANFLTDCLTIFLLGDFTSDPKPLTIGITQGSPLSLILYILYNSPLLRVANGKQDTISLGFIDDIAVVTARPTLKEVTDQLQSLADCELKWGSKHSAAFDKAKSQWMVLSHNPQPSPSYSWEKLS